MHAPDDSAHSRDEKNTYCCIAPLSVSHATHTYGNTHSSTHINTRRNTHSSSLGSIAAAAPTHAAIQ